MGRTIGFVSLFLVIGFAILFILGIWGVFPVNFLDLGRFALTLIVLFFTLLFAFGVYAIFFWKGNERQLPTSSKEKAMMDQRKTDN